ncbi:MAG: hypothetical protein GQF41_0458 [Candidatus Rifleibacterium amylolyticum]|nr:MAG: hypothetical protein GQF41_0458 [Candidatus Rifleibacterium amylolyticum]
MTALKKLTVKGFKSIRELVDFELSNLNVFIGANGSGKSNLISLFTFIQKAAENALVEHVMVNGGINDFFFYGRKTTEKIEVGTRIDNIAYGFDVVEMGSPAGSCFVQQSIINFDKSGNMSRANNIEVLSTIVDIGGNEGVDPNLLELIDNHKILKAMITSWQIYHFDDTTRTAGMRHAEIIQDDKRLRADAANLAPFLLKLKNQWPEEYRQIVSATRLVMPYFADFNLEVRKFGEAEKINLSWFQKGSDYPFQPYHLSDGSIRFIALATALLQPEPPSLIIIDEPELGLHPEAIHILAELIKDAARRTQVIVATQSPTLLDNFAVEDIVVVNRENGASTFMRLNEEDFKVWLEDYSVGELWTKNVIAGGPVGE